MPTPCMRLRNFGELGCLSLVHDIEFLRFCLEYGSHKKAEGFALTSLPCKHGLTIASYPGSVYEARPNYSFVTDAAPIWIFPLDGIATYLRLSTCLPMLLELIMKFSVNQTQPTDIPTRFGWEIESTQTAVYEPFLA